MKTAMDLTEMGVKAKDALQLACVIALNCDYFLTTDDHLIKRSARITQVKVTDPIAFIKEELE